MKTITKQCIFLLLSTIIPLRLGAAPHLTDTTKKSANRNLSLVNSPYLRLQLAKDAINTDDIMIRFNNAATNGYDINMDATYFQGNGQVNLSGISADNVSLAINVLPFPQNAVAIRLKVLAKTDGAYKLNLTQLINVPPLFDIILKDAYKGDSLNIRRINSYSFNILKNDTNTYGSARFSLVVRQNPALAVKLLKFAATKTDTGAIVAWSTANEQNYTKFTVERSIGDSQMFNAIDTLTSAGLGVYSFTDKNPAKGTDLYRLKLQDIAGSVTYSTVVSLTNNSLNANAMGIYPNPASGVLNLTITPATDPTSTLYKIQIFNTTGNVIKSSTTGQQNSQTDISALSPGTYIIRVLSTKGDRIVGKGRFIKL